MKEKAELILRLKSLIAEFEDVAPAPSVPTDGPFNKKLFDFYSVKKNYDAVYNDVMDWFVNHSTENACAAFCSTALRHLGLDIPFGPVSLLAQGLADHLITRGWKKITSGPDLLPGDVIVTQDAPSDPGYAAHIWVLGSKMDSSGFGVAIDNQGFLYRRNITAAGPKTPWHYGLRAP